MKKCYGLDIPVEGKPKWVHENPYNYVEKLGYLLVDDFFHYKNYWREEDKATPIIEHFIDDNFYMMFYEPKEQPRDFNKIGSGFLNAMFYGYSQYCDEREKLYKNVIVINHPVTVPFNKDQIAMLKQLIKDMKWFYGDMK